MGGTLDKQGVFQALGIVRALRTERPQVRRLSAAATVRSAAMATTIGA